MKKNISILNDKILVKRIEELKEEKPLILGVPTKTEQEPYFKGNVLKIGFGIATQIDCNINDIIVYDKYPEIIKIDDELYDLISVLNIKYVEHKVK